MSSRKLYIFLLAISGFLILSSCSQTKSNWPESPTTGGTDPNTGGNTGKQTVKFFPLIEKSYWIYEVYQLDSLGKRVGTTPSMDSVVISGKAKKLEKDAFVFSTFRTANGRTTKSADEFYYVADNKLYTFSSLLTSGFGGGMVGTLIGIEEKWVPYLDPNDELWRIYKKELTGQSGIPFAAVTGKIDVIASKEFEKNISVPAGSFKPFEYIISYSFVGNINAMGNTIPVNVQRDIYLYPVDNIGIVRSKSQPSELAIPLLGGIKIPGEEKNLIRYYIAK